MELTVKIAGFKENDPNIQRMLDKKAELQAICQGYEDMLKEQLPQYAIDGVLPAVQIVPDPKTMEVLKGLQSGIADAISGNRGKAIPHTNNPPASANKIPNGNTAPGNPSASSSAPVPGKRKQRPGDQPSPSQRKYLNDLLRANGLDLSRWCQDNNVQEDQITVAHCQQWIPKLREMAEEKIFLTPQV